MRHFSIALIIAASTAGSTVIAFAADLPVKAPVAPVAAPAYNWTGFYVGANIGGGWGSRDVNFTPNDPVSLVIFPTTPSLSFDSSGVIGGLQLGYNWQFNRNWLVGLETDFDWSSVKGSGSTTAIAPLQIPGLPFTANADEHIKWFGTVRARLGYLPMDNLLAYVTGGFAYGKVENSGSFVNISSTSFGLGGITCLAGTTCYAGSSSHVATGWTLGGGLEYALWQRWTLRAEYLYISLENTSVAETAVILAPASPTLSINANFNRTNLSVARAGVNYRF